MYFLFQFIYLFGKVKMVECINYHSFEMGVGTMKDRNTLYFLLFVGFGLITTVFTAPFTSNAVKALIFFTGAVLILSSVYMSMISTKKAKRAFTVYNDTPLQPSFQREKVESLPLATLKRTS